MRSRLLVVAASLGGGGAERVLVTLLHHFRREKFELHLALVDASGPYLSQIPRDVSVHDLRSGRVRRAFFPILRAVRRLRPSAVLSTLGYLNLAVLAGRALWPPGVRAWVREANIPSVSLSNAPGGGLFRRLYPRLYRLADGIICNTEEVRRDLTETFGIPASKLRVIVNPVDEEAVRARAAEGGSPFQGSGTHVVAAGRLTRQKGFDLLIRAAGPLLRRRPGARLTLLGAGPEEAALRKLAESQGVSDSVRTPGFVENPYRYFKAADLFVLSSRWEGSPNVVLEALTCGTPVVAFDCAGGGLREIARDAPEVELVPAEDVEALGEAVERRLNRKKPDPAPSLLPPRFRVGSVVRQYEEALAGGEGL